VSRRDAWDRCLEAEHEMAVRQVTSSQIDLRNVIVAVVEERMEHYTEAEQDAASRAAFNHFVANGGVEYDVQVGELLYSTVRDAVSDALEAEDLMPDYETAQDHGQPSPFEVAGTATYDAATDTLRTAPAGWYVEIVRYSDDESEEFENILIGPFDTEEAADEHAQFSTDVEDWVTDEAKQKGYTVDDVLIVHNPTLIPSYGINAPVYPVYAEGACLGILPGTEN
jgi:hypothetical protein